MSDISDNNYNDVRGGSHKVSRSMVENSLADINRPSISHSLRNIQKIQEQNNASWQMRKSFDRIEHEEETDVIE